MLDILSGNKPTRTLLSKFKVESRRLFGVLILATYYHANIVVADCRNTNSDHGSTRRRLMTASLLQVRCSQKLDLTQLSPTCAGGTHIRFNGLAAPSVLRSRFAFLCTFN
jgi:hypothetical protein